MYLVYVRESNETLVASWTNVGGITKKRGWPLCVALRDLSVATEGACDVLQQLVEVLLLSLK